MLEHSWIDGDARTADNETSSGVDANADCEHKRTGQKPTMRWGDLASLGLLTLLPCLVFGQLWNSEFISYDDPDYVRWESLVTQGLTGSGAWQALTTFRFANWHPVTWWSLMLDYSLYGSSPGWFHLTNVILHIASGWILFAWLRMLNLGTIHSLLVAVLFSIHPLHVEPVAWVSSRKDVLSTFFLLCSLVFYVRYAYRPHPFRYAVVVVLFSLGLMSKSMLVTTPILLVMVDVWLLQRWRTRSASVSEFASTETPPRCLPPASSPRLCPAQPLWFLVMEKIPLLVLSLATVVLSFQAQRAFGAVQDTSDSTIGERLSHIVVSYAFYVRKTFIPLNLTLHYPYDRDLLTMGSVGFSAVLLVVITYLAVRPGPTRAYRLCGCCWYLVSLLPVCGLVRLGGLAAADRYSYVPLIGLFLALTVGLPFRPTNSTRVKYWVGAVTSLACGVLAVLAHRQTSYWQDSETVFRHAVQVARPSPRTHGHLGLALEKKNQLVEATVHYREGIRLETNIKHVFPRIALARILTAQNDIDGALALLSEAAAIRLAERDRPEMPTPSDRKEGAAIFHFWGRALVARQDYGAAIAKFEEAKTFDESSALLHADLGDAFVATGLFSEAVQSYRRSVELDPRHWRWKQKLARLLASGPDAATRNHYEALRLAKAACESTARPRPECLDTLAIAYASQGNFDQAVMTIQSTLDAGTAHPDLAKQLQEHLALFEQRVAFVLPGPVSQRMDE